MKAAIAGVGAALAAQRALAINLPRT